MDDDFEPDFDLIEFGPDEVLATAANLISGDRREQYGDATTLFEKIAALWSAYTGYPISPHDACIMLGLMKDARIKVNPNHIDNYIDGAGYRAIAVELPAFGSFTLCEEEE